MNDSEPLLHRYFVFRDGMWELPTWNAKAFHAEMERQLSIEYLLVQAGYDPEHILKKKETLPMSHQLRDIDGSWYSCGCSRITCPKHNYMRCTQCNPCPKKDTPPMPTPRTTVTVDGVTLTRQQIEKAHEELNKPVEPTGRARIEALQRGDRFICDNYITYLVTDLIEGKRRFISVTSGIVCVSSLDGLGRMVDEGRIVIHPKAR